MHYQDRCPDCDQIRSIAVDAAAGGITCPRCGAAHAWPTAAFVDGKPTCCLGCGNTDLWRQKDFPQSVGLLMVALGAILSSIAWAYHYPVLALSILAGFGLLDMLLFWIMPDVLVCYRCRARHRVGTAGEEFAGYNHELGERYRQERLRLASRSGGPAAPTGA